MSRTCRGRCIFIIRNLEEDLWSYSFTNLFLFENRGGMELYGAQDHVFCGFIFTGRVVKIWKQQQRGVRMLVILMGAFERPQRREDRVNVF